MSNALRRWRLKRRLYSKPHRVFHRGGGGAIWNPLRKSFWMQFGADSPAKRWLLVGISVFAVGAFFTAILSIGLPNPAKLVFGGREKAMQIYDRNGELLVESYGVNRNRTAVPFVKIPDNIKHATVALEDKRFYEHKGIDYMGLARGAFRTVFQGQTQSGSTLTQQFVKNALLSPEQTLTRKIKELILTFEIERLYTKDKILEMYLNEIPYGGSAYGVEVASESFFGKHVEEVSLAEAATLASIPQRPTYYSPWGSHIDQLMARKDFTLQKMYEQKFITKAELDKALKEEIKFLPRSSRDKAVHFVEYVKEQLADEFGEKMVEQGGLRVVTSLDYKKQTAAEEAVASRVEYNLKNYKAGNAAMVSLDPKTGEILAMVGSADYFSQEIEGAVNVVTRPRQPGSSIKPIVYAAAFEKGYSPATMLMDVVTDFGQGYTPKNYNLKEYGPVSIRQALANSLNIPAVKTLAYVGVKQATDFAQRLGISSLNQPDRYGLSLVLGGGEVNLLELTGAYGVFANGGKLVKPVSILEVRDAKGRLLSKYEPEKAKSVLDPQVAYLISSILSDDGARSMVFGSGSALAIPGRTVAAKTGTTDKYVDAWTVGYTPDIVTGVWVGNNRNAPMNAGGSMAAAPIWNKYMKSALQGVPNKSFDRPAGITEVAVDALSGKLPTDASPSTKTEVFADFALPKDKDDVHVKVKVPIVAPDKLAPANMAAEMIEEKIFAVLHSEQPNNSNWENPVIAWAKANGYNNVPTERFTGDVSIGGSDVVQITSPKNGDKLTGGFLIKAQVTKPVDKVEFYLDNALIGQATKAPYQMNYIPSVTDGSAHKLTAKAIVGGSPTSYQIYVTLGKTA